MLLKNISGIYINIVINSRLQQFVQNLKLDNPSSINYLQVLNILVDIININLEYYIENHLMKDITIKMHLLKIDLIGLLHTLVI
jgi:hypothetical protein